MTINLPTFWASIESAWSTVPASETARASLLSPDSATRVAAVLALDEYLGPMLDALRATLNAYSRTDLAEWDAHAERLLYNLDREDVHEALDGSDDGFLYARGFVVAAGQAYYDAIDKDPELAVMDVEAESFCYIAAHIHNERFGEWTPDTGICRESGSNRAAGRTRMGTRRRQIV